MPGTVEPSLGDSGKAKGTAPVTLPVGWGGGKIKGRPLCSDGAVLYLDNGGRKLHGTMYTHTHGCVQLIHRLYQCQCPGRDRVLQLCKISLLGKLGKGVARLYLIVLHLPVRLELFPNENIFF